MLGPQHGQHPLGDDLTGADAIDALKQTFSRVVRNDRRRVGMVLRDSRLDGLRGVIGAMDQPIRDLRRRGVLAR